VQSVPPDVRLSWTPIQDSTAYDVVRGDIAVLSITHGDFSAAIDACAFNNTLETSAPAMGDPVAGDGFFYLVRPMNCGGPGSYDTADGSQVGSRDAEIAASPHACP
jgi:hypothetical protein